MFALHIELLSDGCFAGSWNSLLRDADLAQELDEQGLPRIGGRALRGLLQEEVALLLRVLSQDPYAEAAAALFGTEGTPGKLRIGDAQYPPEVRDLLRSYQSRDKGDVLAPLAAQATTILRGQTKIEHGVAREGSLRHTRLLRAGQKLSAPLDYQGGSLAQAPEAERALLAAAALLVRHGGMHRSRGWGRLQVRLREGQDDRTDDWSKPLLAALEAA